MDKAYWYWLYICKICYSLTTVKPTRSLPESLRHDWLEKPQLFEDVSPTKNGAVPASHVSFPRGFHSFPSGGFLKYLKCWYPTTTGFPTKNDHFGVFLGVPPWKETPIYTLIQIPGEHYVSHLFRRSMQQAGPCLIFSAKGWCFLCVKNKKQTRQAARLLNYPPWN